MDISNPISELLFEHDCVIIPGFGGFIGNYKPADVHPVLHTIAPPSKAISFNRNLQSNDGLLVNYISRSQNISFDAANETVLLWVNASKNLLKKGEELRVNKIGKLSNDIEGNLQFAPVEEINYLKTSFGLRTITVEPILRAKQIDFTEKFKHETKHEEKKTFNWRIAALMLLFISLAGVGELMWMGVEIKQLHLDEAQVFGFINTIFKSPEPILNPIPIEAENIPVVTDSVLAENDISATGVVDSSLMADVSKDLEEHAVLPDVVENKTKEEVSAVKEDSFVPQIATGHRYYVIIGAFVENENIEAAKLRLQQKFPDSVILIEKGKHLTKLGYSVGNSFYQAKEKLLSAQQEDSTFWLLKK